MTQIAVLVNAWQVRSNQPDLPFRCARVARGKPAPSWIGRTTLLDESAALRSLSRLHWTCSFTL